LLNLTPLSPGRRPFYKYASPVAAHAILENGTVRYSSPILFNDPFDVQSGLHFDFDLDSLHEKILDRIESLASSPDDPPVDPGDIWGQVVLVARKHYPSHGFPKARWREMTLDSFQNLRSLIRDTQEGYRTHWRKNFLPGLRVFCVSEERDNLLMWAHYAEDHKGAVFEMWSLPEEDNPLSVAQPVEYLERPPPFFTESQWVDDMVGIKKLNFSELYHKYAYRKSKHWAYEKEWRVWYPSTSSEQFDYTPINTRELQAVYLGCQTAPDFRAKIIDLVTRKYPEAKVYQARKSETDYRLEFTYA
jgi:hypothetical protein